MFWEPSLLSSTLKWLAVIVRNQKICIVHTEQKMFQALKVKRVTISLEILVHLEFDSGTSF